MKEALCLAVSLLERSERMPRVDTAPPRSAPQTAPDDGWIAVMSSRRWAVVGHESLADRPLAPPWDRLTPRRSLAPLQHTRGTTREPWPPRAGGDRRACEAQVAPIRMPLWPGHRLQMNLSPARQPRWRLVNASDGASLFPSVDFDTPSTAVTSGSSASGCSGCAEDATWQTSRT